MNALNDHCINICNRLLRGELSAIETYGQVIHKNPSWAVSEELRRIRAEHSVSANRLSANVRSMGGVPEKDSGAWGIFATAVQGAANLFGPESALASLRNGEEAGRNDYQNALLDDQVMSDCKALVREELLPRVIDHLALLEKLDHSLSAELR
ncbi:MAG: DUF2383 domain-containing protein [Verrucomicrobiota bacterium]